MYRTAILVILLAIMNAVCTLVQAEPANPPTQDPGQKIGLEYINTSFENASPLYWDIDTQGQIHIYLIYDYERNSPNRANGHWLFQIQAKPGSTLTVILHNFDNIWNGIHGAPVSKKTVCYLSPDGQQWSVIPTEFLEGDRVKFQVHMDRESLYVARLEPYRISDLEKLIQEIRSHSLVEIREIGKTVEGRSLEIIRVGNPNAPYRVFLRARAHAWEPGGNWVVQGLIRRFLQEDEEVQRYRQQFCVYIMPMANKDGVARGRTRFNSLGMDLNRNWDRPAPSDLAPENYALESWIQSMIDQGKPIHLAIDFHNDEGGNMHISRPNIQLDRYLSNMKILEELMYKYTWFTEGPTGGDFHNAGTIGEGLLERFGIDALVQELNCNWIAGLNKVPTGQDWELLGEQYLKVFESYFETFQKNPQ